MNAMEWLSSHHDFSRDGTDFTLHSCVRFGKVRSAAIVTPDGTAHRFKPDADLLHRVLLCSSWLEAVAIIREAPR